MLEKVVEILTSLCSGRLIILALLLEVWGLPELTAKSSLTRQYEMTFLDYELSE